MKRCTFLLAGLILLLQGALYAGIPDKIAAKLSSQDINERLDACLLLGRLGNPGAVPYLRRMLADKSMLVRHSAANALARIGGREVNEIFKRMVNEDGEEQKRIGLAGLALAGDAAGAGIVMKELDNPSWQVRWSAVYVLGEWGYRPALRKLRKIAEADPYKDKAAGKYPVRERAKAVCAKIISSIEWYRYMDSARLLAQKLHKPILSFWFVEGNMWCRKMECGIFFSPEVADISQGFVCVKIDAEKEEELALRYDVNAVPAVIVLDKDDNIVDRMLGIVSREDLEKRLKGVLENKGTPKKWKENLRKDPKDIESMWFLADWYMDNNRTEDAVSLLRDIIRYDPKNSRGYTDNALFVLGYSLGALGKNKEGADVLGRLIRGYPGFKDIDKAMYCMGLDYLSLGRENEAKDILEEIIDTYPESRVSGPAAEIISKL